MLFKSLLVGAIAALATAQSNPLAFTRVPNPITVGKPQAITYQSNSDAPATILLRRGDSNDLKTVSTLTSSATGGQYIWTPSNDLENGSDYALEIQQSGNEPNYYGPFQIQGSTGSGSRSSASGSGTATHSGSSTTITATAQLSGTSTTLTATYASAGNETSIIRNSTMSRATLTSSSTATSTASETTGGAGFQGTSSAASPSQTGNSASTFAAGGSAIALVFGAVAAIVMG